MQDAKAGGRWQEELFAGTDVLERASCLLLEGLLPKENISSEELLVQTDI